MGTEPLLRLRGLEKSFAQRRWWGAERLSTPAIHDVNLDLEKGRTLGLVGPSGSGKSTLARCVALFEVPSSGEIRFDGRPLTRLTSGDRAAIRSQIQLIFQQPAASLNPRFTAAEVIAEPLLIQRRGTRQSRELRAAGLMETVGLARRAVHYPALEFSGGERQRLAIARALALEPKLLILDESFSGLDLSIQAQITSLLLDLQQRLGLTYILISHDLTLAGQIADEIAVMDSGTIVEHGPAPQLLANPQHSVSKELVSASLALAPGGCPL